MGGGISKMAKQESLATIRDRYRVSSRKDKSRILDEFIAVTGHHRKHGIRLLGRLDDDEGTTHSVRGRRIYNDAVREAVIVIWEAADRICGKRLKAALPTWWSPWSAMATSTSTPSSFIRGTRPATGCQCSHSRPSPETHPSHRGQPAQTPA